MSRRTILALLALAALAAPAGAAARASGPHRSAKAHAPAHSLKRQAAKRKPKRPVWATYMVRGIVLDADPDIGLLTVSVPKSSSAVNAAARIWRGEDVMFDISAARVKIRDVNGDGVSDLNDVNPGDRVVVHARLHLPLGLADMAPYPAADVVVKASGRASGA